MKKLITLPSADDLRGINGKSIRTFELVVTVSGALEGEFKDWPANIQDPIYAAMERKAEEVQLPLELIASEAGWDDIGQRHYVRVILSEIVVMPKMPNVTYGGNA